MKKIAFILQFIFLLNTTNAQQYEFGLFTGGSDTEHGYAIGKDAIGNIYVAGRFNGTQDFDPGAGIQNLTAVSSSSDAFIIKYDSLGALVWAKSFGGSGYEVINDIEIGLNEIIVTGRFEQTVDFDMNAGVTNKVSSGGYDLFMAKYDLNGNYSWVVTFGSSTSDDIGYDVEIDASASIYLSATSKSANINPLGSLTVLNTNSSSSDAIVAKYNSSGILTWAKAFGSVSGGEAAKSLELSPNNQLVIAGEFRGTVDFDPGAAVVNLVSAGITDVFLLWLNPTNGSYILAKKYGGVNTDDVADLDIDNSNNVFVTGYFQGTANFNTSGTTALTSVTFDPDIYFAKYTASGVLSWVNPIGGQYDDRGTKIKIGTTGDVYVTGNFSDYADFDPSVTGNVVIDGHTWDFYLGKYDTNGNIKYAHGFGTGQSDYSGDIYVDDNESVFLTGSVSYGVNMNPSGTNILGQDYQDYFLAKYSQCNAAPVIFTKQPANDTVCAFVPCIIDVALTGGVGAYQWQKSLNGLTWNDLSNNSFYAGVNNDSLIITANQTMDGYYFRCEFTSCTLFYSDSAKIKVNPAVSPNASSSASTICFGDTVYFQSSGADILQWSSGIIDNVAHIPTVVGMNTFSLTGTNAITNCTSQTEIGVEVFPNPTLTLNLSSTVLCSGDSVFVDAQGANVLNWNHGAIEETYLVPNPGTFYLTCEGIDLRGCSAKDSTMITVYPSPTVFAGNDILACSGSVIILQGSGASTYVWDNGVNNNQPFAVSSNQAYAVTGTDLNGCSDSDIMMVNITTTPIPSICEVTVDSAGVNNEIYWEKSLFPMVDSFIVYREVSGGIYRRIGATSKNALCMYVDTNRSIGPNNGNPNVTSYKYKLQLRDTCGNYSALSLWHQTIYFIDNQTGSFQWIPYFIESSVTPVGNYELKRRDIITGTETSTGQFTSSTIISDPQWATYWPTNTKWFVDAIGFNCDPTLRVAHPNGTLATKVKTKSNHANDKIGPTKLDNLSSVMGNNIRVYPNPAKDKVTIELGISANVSIELTDVLGQSLVNIKTSESINTINTGHYVSGVYFLNIKLNNKTVAVKKVIIE